MRNAAWLVLTAALLCVTAAPTAQEATRASTAPNPEARRQALAAAFPDVDRLFQEFVTRSRVPGAAWGIVVDGELVHTGVTGLRDVDARAPVTPDTVFRIASMTKSFTAMAILKVRDEGRLSLDDPAEKYIPELKGLRYPTTDSPRITIRHLLSHAAGFPEDNAWGDRHLADSEEAFTRMIESGIPFSNAPGLVYEYSNYGFALLGRIVTRASGTPYNDYVTRHILTPLGMSSTTLEPRAVSRGRLALGYRLEDDRWTLEPLLEDGAFGAMGGMLTTVPDLARYVGALLSAWPARDGPETGPVRRASLREMQLVAERRPASVGRTPSGTITLNAGGYGYGLRVTQTCDINHAVAHGGGLPGFGSLMHWLPEHGVGIITFANLTYTGWGGVVNTAIERLAATGALTPRAATPSPRLIEARAAVAALAATGDDAPLAAMAADNLFLDRPRERRRADVDALRAKVGRCEPGAGFDYVENALRGEWTMTCERGAVRAAVTLAPTMPPRIQVVSLREAQGPPPSRGACPAPAK